MDRWRDALTVAATSAAVVVGTTTMLGLGPAGVAVQVAVAVAVVWLLSPLSSVGPHTPHAAALDGAGPDDLVGYWRPGCSVAVGLMVRLPTDVRREVTWVHVLRDREAEAFVRSLRDGDMVTPTVVTGGGDLVPATVEDLRAHLQR